MQCRKCGKDVVLPFKCPYCGEYFCSEHRLPENHDCSQLGLARAPRREEMALNREPYGAYGYSVTYVPTGTRREFHFSRKEISHLGLSALLVFGIGLSWGLYRIGSFPMLLLFATFVMLSFLLHELAHKFAAQRAGLWAEFRIVLMGFILTAISVISPFFKIVSPGAVMISGFTSKANVGKISIVGPSANLALTFVLIVLWLLVPFPVIMYLAAINAWIALFNLIPLGVLDGFKVFLWSKKAWTMAFSLSLILTILTFFYF
ncbi:MAG: AN1-type zinc finger domain-containing protein [Candidatus Bathyarchaeia archaeon]